MKRSEELKSLSHDHHHGLVHAHRMQKAAAGDGANPVEDTARAFLEFWQKDASAHFRKEEEVLLPVAARYGEDIGREPITEMLRDHAVIRGLVMGLSDEITGGGVEPETLRTIGERLEAHIRLEERVVFPLIEESLPEAALAEVAARLEVGESGPRAEPWVPTDGLSYDPWPGPGDSEGGGYD